MKQFMFEYSNAETFNNELMKFKDWCVKNSVSKMLFQVYSEILEEDIINNVCNVIEEVFPDTLYIGCSTSGNITDCQLSQDITVACTVFEFPSTQVNIYQYYLDSEVVDSITWKILEETRKNPWVKAIELFFTIPENSSTRFCDGLKEVRQDIQIFGGVACSDDITSDASCVFSKGGKYSGKSVVVVFYGGSDFYVDSINVTGWKPLEGSSMLQNQMAVFYMNLMVFQHMMFTINTLISRMMRISFIIHWSFLYFMNIMAQRYCVPL